MKHSFQVAFKSWIGLTLLVIASLIVVYARNGMAGLEFYIQQWPLSDLSVTLSAAMLTLLCAGALLYMLANEKINAGNAFTVSGFFLVMFVYLNILRERFRYGDYEYYIQAAKALLRHETLPRTYLYLPLWATLIQYIVPLGDQGVLTVLWIVNMIALGGFYFLLQRHLERYGFSARFSALITIIFVLLNTPILRTLGYVQVNLLVMDCALLSILYYPKNTFISALTLALAVHLKTSPAALILAFLLELDWRWMAWFILSFIVIGIFPLAVNGISPYLDYLNNISTLAQRANSIFHETSFDSFLRFFDPFFGINLFWTRIMIYAAKAALLLTTIMIAVRHIRAKYFFNENMRGQTMLNSIPPLFILMTLISPIVWEHHGIFVTLPFLLMLKRIESPSAWMWFGCAYFLEFIMPSFDFFPWSYGRLIAPLIILALMWKSANKNESSHLFNTLNIWFTNLDIPIFGKMTV